MRSARCARSATTCAERRHEASPARPDHPLRLRIARRRLRARPPTPGARRGGGAPGPGPGAPGRGGGLLPPAPPPPETRLAKGINPADLRELVADLARM